MAEQITITVGDGTTRSLQMVGQLLMNGISAEEVIGIAVLNVLKNSHNIINAAVATADKANAAAAAIEAATREIMPADDAHMPQDWESYPMLTPEEAQ